MRWHGPSQIERYGRKPVWRWNRPSYGEELRASREGMNQVQLAKFIHAARARPCCKVLPGLTRDWDGDDK